MAMSTSDKKGAASVFIENFKRIPFSFRDAFSRHDIPPESEREKAAAVFSNFFLHLHPTRVSSHVIKPTYTLGLGLMCAFLFLILGVTGVVLMIYYIPHVDGAYASVKNIRYAVTGGKFVINLHRWSAHGMVLAVLLHMMRVFYTGSYKSPREFNWMIGVVLLALTLALSFTGYLLPYDQLAYWAMTIGANIAGSLTELTDAIGVTKFFDPGKLQKQLIIGGNTIGEPSLIRFYFLHVILLPIVISIFIGVHLWRITKDGGLSKPLDSKQFTESANPDDEKGSNPEKTYGLMSLIRGNTPQVGNYSDDTVPTWPNVLIAEGAVFIFCLAAMCLLSLFFDAPLKELANPAVPENPAKAPWYFLGLQELVSYSAFVGGILVPSITVLGLMLIPFLDRELNDVGVWFSGSKGISVVKRSAVYGFFSLVALIAFTIKFGWLRSWFPGVPQIVIIAINPATVIIGLFALWYFKILKETGSMRLASIAAFTLFIIGFAVLTYVGTFLRGPNWDFFWLQSQWPGIHFD